MRKLMVTSALLGACMMPGKIHSSVPDPLVVTEPRLTEYIAKSNPKLARDEAVKMAWRIEDAAKSKGLDPVLFAAMIRQESYFKSGIKVCYYVNQRHTCDYGLAQVNSLWIDILELDAKKLRNDDEYNLNIAAGVLQDAQKKCRSLGRYSYSCYNSASPVPRKVYQAHIEKHLRIARAMVN
jgi:hypothetical protein